MDRHVPDFSISPEPFLATLRKASRCGLHEERQALIEILTILGGEEDVLCREFVSHHAARLSDTLLLPEAIAAGHAVINSIATFREDNSPPPPAREMAHRIASVRACSPPERLLRLHVAASLVYLEPQQLRYLLEALETSPDRFEPLLIQEIADFRRSQADGIFVKWSRGTVGFDFLRQKALPLLELALTELEEALRHAPHARYLREVILHTQRTIEALADEERFTRFFWYGDLG